MKESTKNVILTLASIVFAGLVIVFFAVPNVSFDAVITTETASGFDYYDAGSDFMKAMLIITMIFACLTVLFAIFKMLVDAKLIKSKSVAKFINLLFIVSAIALVVSSILYMISVITMCNDSSISIGDYTSMTPVFWSIILMPVFALISLVCAFMARSKK